MKYAIITAVCILAAAASCAAEKPRKESSVLTDNEKEYLVNLARQTLCSYLGEEKLPKPPDVVLTDNMKQKLGCFVTLNKKGSGLRGCIGTFERSVPLYENVISRAIAAAVHDSRFKKVTYAELTDIKIEVSVLTAPVPLPCSSPEDLLSKLVPEKHGVLLYTKFGSSTFLPQVWEQLPDKKQFLSHLCTKHGAPADAWKSDFDNLRIETYEAIVFGEDTFGRIITGPAGAKAGPEGATILGWVDAPGKKPADGEKKVEPGTAIKPGTILTPGSDIVRN